MLIRIPPISKENLADESVQINCARPVHGLYYELNCTASVDEFNF